MNYVVKVGKFYVKDYDWTPTADRKINIDTIVLSNEVMTGFTENTAEVLAKKVDGDIIEIKNDTTELNKDV